MTVINTNISATLTANALIKNERAMGQTMERLSTGLRINSAADDAAGLAISSKMTSQINGLNQAARNSNDAISMLQTADGAAIEITNMLQRMRELAVQSANGTYENADRANADYEYEALKNEITRIASVTAFNRQTLAQGSSVPSSPISGTTGSTATSFSFYVGSDVAKTGNTVSFAAGALDLNIATSGAQTLASVSTTTLARDAIANIDGSLNKLAANRAQAGALVNRLEHTVSNLMNVSQRLQEAVSGIEDADYAAESANLARGMVLAQAGTAMLAQANQAPQYILSLLRG